MKRPLIALQALLACSTVLCQSGQAAGVFSPPDPANPIESRIETVRNGDWSQWLRPSEGDDQQLAKSKWGNGGGHSFKNSRGSGKWKNGSDGGKWSNSRPTWHNASYHGGWGNGGGGWRNGSGSWRNGGGGFVNW